MTEGLSFQALLRLQAWLSPVFPTGSFAYSSGLECAVHERLVVDEKSLAPWLETLISHGAVWNDAVLFCEAWKRGVERTSIHDLIDLGSAMASSSERHLETMAQGAAFMEAVGSWPLPGHFEAPGAAPLPIAIGSVCGAMDIPLQAALAAYLQAFTANQLQAAIRLSVLGQKGAARLMAKLEPALLAAGEKAAQSTLDDLGSASIFADIMAMRHETQETRLFRS